MAPSITLESQNSFEVGPRSKIVQLLHSSMKKTRERDAYQSSSAEDRDKEVRGGGMVKRSSIHLGSKEIRTAIEVRGGGKNSEPCLNYGAFPSFELMESTPWGTSPSIDNIRLLPKSNTEFLELSFRDLPEERSKISISYSDVAPAGSSPEQINSIFSAKNKVINTATSPVHLHSVLKWEFNHGDSSYQFSVKDPEYVLCAKTWKTENVFNWVYTFHCCKVKSNIINHGKKNRHLRPSLMVGQMQVSRYLCSEVSEDGSVDNSVVTEFTLYDIAQAKNSIVTERSHFSSNLNHYSGELNSDPSTSYPWASAELQPNHEIAAIVTQFPLTMIEDLKNMQARDRTRVAIRSHSSSPYVKAITPSGRHGLPKREELGPSSLLDRWRFGGGCDCGGWDMGCPIVVFDNGDNDNVSLRVGTQQPTVLFVKGKKEKVPALTITATGKGQYAVDFHAQLSALQAFSICISILHSSEASSAIGEDCNDHKLCPNSLELILEEKMRHIIETAAEEERKEKRKVEQSPPPSFFLDPPFSPMGRV
ncbi:uncharacterized protein LOC110032922 [Phalaenopsis equestris]|uniref:uncharacterized protein LOC110032922 n=1 Tax=Phalaenopsis equestris TaxID=78828 RepID=UPI0009E42744|nr:uncharacterized protein LOC110032922 [Phalaenopsis equestris]XP_020592371.1 uncharacterized protein LOC110032922 [Phalaenopsis equestris]XP_020592373.1 uncharacterized protein LOC110032922 [Phalaenopsis equestris]XP_020592374.1 uncharacterized protein LOC110032922 [Phalaenopsis equestris]XP_020592375.1 uncharacterized protein LOC110032922 [Phalaenopsis equestris]